MRATAPASSKGSNKTHAKGIFMTSRKLFLLPGDGIGPEAMAEVRKLIAVMNAEHGAGFEIDEGLVGGCAYDAHGAAISDADKALVDSFLTPRTAPPPKKPKAAVK